MAGDFFQKKSPARKLPDGERFHQNQFWRRGSVAWATERGADFVATSAAAIGRNLGLVGHRRSEQTGHEKTGKEHFFGFHVKIFLWMKKIPVAVSVRTGKWSAAAGFLGAPAATATAAAAAGFAVFGPDFHVS